MGSSPTGRVHFFTFIILKFSKSLFQGKKKKHETVVGPNVSKLGNQKKTCSILIFPFVSSSTHLSLVFDSPKRPSLVSAQPWLLAPILLLSLHRSPLLSKPENSSLLSPILAPADPPVLFISKPKGALGFQTHLSVSRFFAPLITTKVSFPFSIQPFDSQSWKLLVLI